MPLRISGRQLNKLGERLASPEPITDDDYAMLGQVAQDYQAALDKVEEKLQGLGYQATTRVKTTGTLVDKLRRAPHLKLKSIHDLAGARIVIGGGRQEQDKVVKQIMAAFADCPKAPEPIDRREKPSYGYRAFHIVVYEDGLPIEIQIRTELQDRWAQITEKLGDTWGRGLRYGLGPDQPDALIDPSAGGGNTRADMMKLVAQLAEVINLFEETELVAAQLRTPLGGQIDELIESMGEGQVAINSLLAVVSALGGAK